MKRPGVDIFLEVMAQYFELIIFTVSTNEYANKIMDLLDP